MVTYVPGRAAALQNFQSMIFAVAAMFVLSACGTTSPEAGTPKLASSALASVPSASVPNMAPAEFNAVARKARIVNAGQRLECVAYARSVSGIRLRGDAATWWRAAAGRYARGPRPEAGAVLVFRSTQTSAGHLAVVTRMLGPRLVIADHANWLNRGHVHTGTPIEDVSAKGDWSSVRVWYTPGESWGRRAYRTFGFIYPRPETIAALPPR